MTTETVSEDSVTPLVPDGQDLGLVDRWATTAASVLVVAPFDRDLEFGGSQRATALAEALEGRGFTTTWWKPSIRSRSAASRLTAVATGDPEIVRHYDPQLPSGEWDVVVVEHSYLARCLDYSPRGSLPVVDFHNLEWQQLKDMATVLPLPRRWYYQLQARRMASFEASLATRVPITCFTSTAELAWANRHGGTGGLVVPNVLPRSTAAAAEGIWAQRQQRPASVPPVLLYVGKLDFLPNFESLRRFVAEVWPTVSAADSGSRLLVAGRVLSGREHELEGRGVEVLGYVEDLSDLMVQCRAALLPLTALGGTSLRVLWYALAGVPMIGSEEAFRGFDPSVGFVARTVQEWVDAIRACCTDDATVVTRIGAAKATASRINGSRVPWDRLAERLREGLDAPVRRPT